MDQDRAILGLTDEKANRLFEAALGNAVYPDGQEQQEHSSGRVVGQWMEVRDSDRRTMMFGGSCRSGGDRR